jgi:hypothetical protein
MRHYLFQVTFHASVTRQTITPNLPPRRIVADHFSDAFVSRVLLYRALVSIRKQVYPNRSNTHAQVRARSPAGHLYDRQTSRGNYDRGLRTLYSPAPRQYNTSFFFPRLTSPNRAKSVVHESLLVLGISSSALLTRSLIACRVLTSSSGVHSLCSLFTSTLARVTLNSACRACFFAMSALCLAF